MWRVADCLLVVTLPLHWQVCLLSSLKFMPYYKLAAGRPATCLTYWCSAAEVCTRWVHGQTGAWRSNSINHTEQLANSVRVRSCAA